MLNQEKEKEDLIQEWPKIRAEQQQELDPLDEKIVKLNQQASALLGEDDDAADAIFAQIEDLESEKKALAAKHTEVKSQWAQKMASKRTEHLKAAVTLPSQMAEARKTFIGVAEKTTSAPAAPTAATEDPAITAKRKALLAEVLKCMDAKSKLSAAHSQATKNDDELLATNNLKVDEYRARKAEREKALQDIAARINEARQIRKAFLEEVETAAACAAKPPKVFKVPEVPKTTPRKVMPAVSLGPPLPPASPTGSDSLEASLGESAISFASKIGDVTADMQRQQKNLIKAQKAFMEAKLKKKRKDYYEQPRLTGITKLTHPLMVQLISESLANDKFNDLGKELEPRNGDLYIYKCDKKETVAALDQLPWRNDGVDKRTNQKFPNWEFEQTNYIKSKVNREERKYILTDHQHGIQVLHYRLAIIPYFILKQCKLK